MKIAYEYVSRTCENVKIVREIVKTVCEYVSRHCEHVKVVCEQIS